MLFSSLSFPSLPTRGFFFRILIFFLLKTSYGAQPAYNNEKVTNIGAIVDITSRIGKEQKVAMEIAAQNFNNKSKNHKLSLYFQDSASSAKQMIEEKKIEMIVGMKTWQEAALVGKVGNRTQVPVISLAAPSITPPLMQLRWPFLITMANDLSYEIKCIADLVCAYNWRKVVVIIEDDEYGGDMGIINLLNEALQSIGSEIESRLVLPPYSSLSDPKTMVLDEIVKLLQVQSRAFIVLRSSLPMVSHLFREAKKQGLLDSDSAWIITESITSLLGSVDNSVISSMKGTLGIKSYYSKTSSSYKAFYSRFEQLFGEENPQEGDSNPGIYALQAYDSIGAITQVLERMASNTSSEEMLEKILSADFEGLDLQLIFLHCGGT
ncbi:glutamate receptor 2.4-like [Morus notabilis]|uniref:glutamate receptor 2.4-like n=1 Tax=Morus notabilis TaxID=981085 RepID=UPI000CED65C2|nr:glutamate receptor 2.4-like [Morus notabilis]